MADEFDRSSEEQDRLKDARIKQIQDQAKVISYPPKGICYWCSCAVSMAKVYCDSECRDDHEKFLRQKNIRREA